MKGKSPVEKVKDQKSISALHWHYSKQASKNWKLTMQKTNNRIFCVKLQIASMDRIGLQSLIKKSPPMFVLYIFLGMHYSAASINREEIRVFFFFETKKKNKKKKRNKCEGS